MQRHKGWCCCASIVVAMHLEVGHTSFERCNSSPAYPQPGALLNVEQFGVMYHSILDRVFGTRCWAWVGESGSLFGVHRLAWKTDEKVLGRRLSLAAAKPEIYLVQTGQFKTQPINMIDVSVGQAAGIIAAAIVVGALLLYLCYTASTGPNWSVVSSSSVPSCFDIPSCLSSSRH